MDVKTASECDHLNLSPLDRKLISIASGSSPRVYLEAMDKGLSGSSVWQSRWVIPGDRMSKLHVFKIGPIRKLQAEDAAISNIASVIDPGFPHARLYTVDGESRGLLRQEFAGDAEGITFSLRHYLTKPKYQANPEAAAEIIRRLYKERMLNWHFTPSAAGTPCTNSIDKAVPWWRDKIDLPEVARDIGYQALNKSLEASYSITVEDLQRRVEDLISTPLHMFEGPVHGDLHAQNVNLDEKHNVYLIDYGNTFNSWRALDFIILESAIKFAATPPHCPITDLLALDHALDGNHDALGKEVLFQRNLQTVLTSIHRIRQYCVECGAERNPLNYRYGLICVAAAFTSIEWLINRVYLFHYIAYSLRIAEKMPRGGQ